MLLLSRATCWSFTHDIVKMGANSSEDFQQFLDQNQYSNNGILRYEKLFGRGFVSTGGLETTEVTNFPFASRSWSTFTVISCPQAIFCSGLNYYYISRLISVCVLGRSSLNFRILVIPFFRRMSILFSCAAAVFSVVTQALRDITKNGCVC